jgi:FMN phosphatase YigB (HAD superfamily)
MAIWANTRVDGEAAVREWLTRAGIAEHFRWVVTSIDAGTRKPAAAFFSYALSRCALGKEEVLFVGNQVNTDIQGAIDYGIRCVWLSSSAYRSPDDSGDDQVSSETVRPTHVIETLEELPSLLERLIEKTA